MFNFYLFLIHNYYPDVEAVILLSFSFRYRLFRKCTRSSRHVIFTYAHFYKKIKKKNHVEIIMNAFFILSPSYPYLNIVTVRRKKVLARRRTHYAVVSISRS